MKFEFGLKGRDWIGLYLAGWVLCLVPYCAAIFSITGIKSNPNNPAHIAGFLGFLLVALLSLMILSMPAFKKIIASIKFDGNAFKFNGKISEFVLRIMGNGALTVITLGIYYPWFIKNIYRYLLKSLEFNNIRFDFMGQGLRLLGILAATLILPMMIYLTCFMAAFKVFHTNLIPMAVLRIVLYMMLIPGIYFIYKWRVNFSYNNFVIRWNTKALPAIMKIFIEYLLTIITLGIYGPVALAKLYNYFVSQTIISRDDNQIYSMKADLDYWNVWKVTWGQILLTIVTVGIYGAWAFCRIFGLYVNNTSLVTLEGETS
jgi:uncharacterized membrane protein YjgN (DUF898 family)